MVNFDVLENIYGNNTDHREDSLKKMAAFIVVQICLHISKIELHKSKFYPKQS